VRSRGGAPEVGGEAGRWGPGGGERERGGKGRWAGGGVWAGREAGGVRFGPEREEGELRVWECFF
jgi:hypothetical protein